MTQLVSDGIFGYNPAITVPTPDLERAKQLLKESGFEGNVTLDIPTLPGAETLISVLKQQLADLEMRLQEQRALAARTAKLQELLNLQQASTLPTVAAEVIGEELRDKTASGLWPSDHAGVVATIVISPH